MCFVTQHGSRKSMSQQKETPADKRNGSAQVVTITTVLTIKPLKVCWRGVVCVCFQLVGGQGRLA